MHKACTLYNPDRGNISRLAAKIWQYANNRVKRHLDKWREEVQKQIPVNINSFIREDGGGNGKVRKVKRGETADKAYGKNMNGEKLEANNIANKESTTEITGDKNNVFINTTCNDELTTAIHAVPSNLPSTSTPIVYQSVNSPTSYVQHDAYVRTTQMQPFVHTYFPSTSPIIYQEPFTCFSEFSALAHQPIQWSVNEETRESMGLPSAQLLNDMQIPTGFFHSANGNYLAERRATEEIRHNIGYNNAVNNIVTDNVEGDIERAILYQ
ncbi:3706_t:CDS:1 [Paraglomus occultum]|uniref:3706_t:CDS:1 n=1 Tax=Paraglomus occultum TaxID=144539 RepID=A0A9N9APL6_9GLOM|nr:3706_t:CDS:1 [Paraglomus occultum]